MILARIHTLKPANNILWRFRELCDQAWLYEVGLIFTWFIRIPQWDTSCMRYIEDSSKLHYILIKSNEILLQLMSKSKQSRKGMPNIRLFFNFHSENFQQLTILSHYARSYLHSRTKKNIFLLRKHGTIIFERESACICITTYCMIKLSVKNFWVYVPLYLYVKRQACAHLELTWRFQTYEYMLVNSL